MNTSNIRAFGSLRVRFSVQEDTIAAVSSDTTRFPPWGTSDHFSVQSSDTRRITWGAEHGFGRVEDRYVFHKVDGWTDGDARYSGERGVLVVEEELPNELFKVFVPDVVTQLEE